MVDKGYTLEDKNFKELVQIYHDFIKKFGECETDSPDYRVIENKLNIIEKLLEQKKPGYLKNKEYELEYDIYDDNYTITQVSEIFHVTRQTVHNWMSNYIIPYIKIGNRIYISKATIKKVIQNGTEPKQDS